MNSTFAPLFMSPTCVFLGVFLGQLGQGGYQLAIEGYQLFLTVMGPELQLGLYTCRGQIGNSTTHFASLTWFHLTHDGTILISVLFQFSDQHLEDRWETTQSRAECNGLGVCDIRSGLVREVPIGLVYELWKMSSHFMFNVCAVKVGREGFFGHVAKVKGKRIAMH